LFWWKWGLINFSVSVTRSLVFCVMFCIVVCPFNCLPVCKHQNKLWLCFLSDNCLPVCKHQNKLWLCFFVRQLSSCL
jgi:hypothetical protein